MNSPNFRSRTLTHTISYVPWTTDQKGLQFSTGKFTAGLNTSIFDFPVLFLSAWKGMSAGNKPSDQYWWWYDSSSIEITSPNSETSKEKIAWSWRCSWKRTSFGVRESESSSKWYASCSQHVCHWATSRLENCVFLKNIIVAQFCFISEDIEVEVTPMWSNKSPFVHLKMDSPSLKVSTW